MAKAIFRKVSLDRLASPEQLDQLLEVTTARSWIAVLALGVAIAAGVVWGFEGSSNSTDDGQGVIVRAGGVYNVVSMAPGRVADVRVAVGDVIKPEQVVAHVAQPQTAEKLRQAREELALGLNGRERMQQQRDEADTAKLAAMEKQRSSLQQQIANTEDQIKLAKEQVPVDEQLVSEGLITKQSAISNLQKIASLNENISKLRAQIAELDSEQVSMRNEAGRMGLDNGVKIDQLRQNVELLEEELEMSSKVVSANAGRVVEIKVYDGELVSGGAPVISIEPTGETLEVVAYVPSSMAKEVKPGMRANISPSGVQREEYGYLIGTVSSVGEFPATQEAIQRNFENDTLARSMLSNGPVTEVTMRFIPDPSTFSGLKWSSRKGPPSKVSSGSVCSVEVVTREQAPISLVLPYLKKKLGFK